MKNLSLLGAKSQIENLQRQVKRFETKAENAATEKEASRYMTIAAIYSERVGVLRRWVAERELNIIARKEVAVC